MYEQEKIKPYGSEGGKREQVEHMFDHIAHSYDLLNHFLSWGIDKSWRRTAVDSLSPFHPRHILDVATGTGDFAILSARRLSPQSITGVDISEGMMQVGRQKVDNLGLSHLIRFQREDCEALSFADGMFDAVTVAYGVRNFAHLDLGLKEMCRVLRPGGKVVILEFSTPERFPMKQLYGLYSKIVIPNVGRFISKEKAAYSYLPASIKVVPQGKTMTDLLTRIGYKEAKARTFTFGICSLYTATK